MSDNERNSLLRSSAVVAAGTGLSRASGLLRVAALTYALGRTTLADYYNLANIAPNLVYELLLGGILSATLVPLFVDARDTDDQDTTSALFSTVLAALVIVTVGALVLTQGLNAILNATIDESTAQGASSLIDIETTIGLANLLLPQILFYGLATLCTAALNSRRVFGVPAFTPVLNNVVTSVMFVVAGSMLGGDSEILDVERYDQATVLLLGLGTTVGVAAMSLAMIPSLRRSVPGLRWNFAPRHPAVRRLIGLSGWTIGYVVSNQLALLAVYAMATGSGSGELTTYTTAFIFFQLPHGLFAVSVMTTILPDLSAAASANRMDAFSEHFLRGLRLMLLVVLPAAIGYLVLSQPLLSVLLQRGQFSAEDAEATGRTLMALALGLPGFSVYLYTIRAFFSRKDTRTPFWINAAENALNVALAVPLLFLGSVGLALAYSIAYLTSAIIALGRLRKDVGGFGAAASAAALRSIGRMFVAALIMGLVVWGLSRVVGGDHGSGAIVQLAVCIPVGALVYAAATVLLRIEDISAVTERLPESLRRALDRIA